MVQRHTVFGDVDHSGEQVRGEVFSVPIGGFEDAISHWLHIEPVSGG